METRRNGEVGRGDHAKDPQDDGEGEPSEREHRAEELEHREVRHRDQADPAVARVEEHPLMSAEPFPEPSLPSAALAAERRELLEDLGPADRIRDEGDAVRLTSVAQVAVEAEESARSPRRRSRSSTRQRSRAATGGTVRSAGDDAERVPRLRRREEAP